MKVDIVKGSNYNYCKLTLPQKFEYRYAIGAFRRNVTIKAQSYFQDDNQTCYTDSDSDLRGSEPSSHVAYSNALGMFSPSVNGSVASPTDANVYFYSNSGEPAQYLCRNINCSVSLSIPPFPYDPIVFSEDGNTIGGNPTDVVAFADVNPLDSVVAAAVQLRGGLSEKTKSIMIEWDTTYGAIFERVQCICTVSSYAINLMFTNR